MAAVNRTRMTVFVIRGYVPLEVQLWFHSRYVAYYTTGCQAN